MAFARGTSPFSPKCKRALPAVRLSVVVVTVVVVFVVVALVLVVLVAVTLVVVAVLVSLVVVAVVVSVAASLHNDVYWLLGGVDDALVPAVLKYTNDLPSLAKLQY